MMMNTERTVKLEMGNMLQRPLQLRLHPDPVLRQESVRVIMFDRCLERFLDDMLKFMRKKGGIGLAAPQVGVLKRIIVADIGDGPLKLVNPEIVKKEGCETLQEGCLSIPNYFSMVSRSSRLKIAGRDARGHRAAFETSGLLARVLQHEMDHLDGRLICDCGLAGDSVADRT